MATQTSQEKIDQFLSDVQLLEEKGITHEEIGNRMPGVGKANFSKYFNEVNSITKEFLNKFYKTWGEELPKNINYEKSKADPSKGNTVEEPKREYPRKNIMHVLLEKLVEGQNTIAKSNMILAESNKILAETNQKLVDRLPGMPPLSKDQSSSPEE